MDVKILGHLQGFPFPLLNSASHFYSLNKAGDLISLSTVLEYSINVSIDILGGLSLFLLVIDDRYGTMMPNFVCILEKLLPVIFKTFCEPSDMSLLAKK